MKKIENLFCTKRSWLSETVPASNTTNAFYQEMVLAITKRKIATKDSLKIQNPRRRRFDKHTHTLWRVLYQRLERCIAPWIIEGGRGTSRYRSDTSKVEKRRKERSRNAKGSRSTNGPAKFLAGQRVEGRRWKRDRQRKEESRGAWLLRVMFGCCREHIPFYHASGLRCPRSRCQENGRIFPLRGQHRDRETPSRETEWAGRGTGRRGKEENTKEKPREAALRDRWLGWRDARVFDAINLDHKHRFTATLGVPSRVSRPAATFRALSWNHSTDDPLFRTFTRRFRYP